MYHSRLQVFCTPDYSEILMAEIAEAGFDTFLETEKGFEAYVEMEKYNKEQLQQVKEKYSIQTPLFFYQDRIQKQNWNEEWEKNYEPIVVEDKCLIRAEFHKIEKKVSVRTYYYSQNVFWNWSSSNHLPDDKKSDGRSITRENGLWMQDVELRSCPLWHAS